jgi:hypothetical protein
LSLTNLLIFSESSELVKLVEDNPTSNFFLDEAQVSEKGIPSKTLVDMSKKVSTENYFWIACLSDKPPYKENSIFNGDILIVFSN